jgi:hypothetical protein
MRLYWDLEALTNARHLEPAYTVMFLMDKESRAFCLGCECCSQDLLERSDSTLTFFYNYSISCQFMINNTQCHWAWLETCWRRKNVSVSIDIRNDPFPIKCRFTTRNMLFWLPYNLQVDTTCTIAHAVLSIGTPRNVSRDRCRARETSSEFIGLPVKKIMRGSALYCLLNQFTLVYTQYMYI